MHTCWVVQGGYVCVGARACYHCGILLGTIPCRVKFRWSKHAQHIEPYNHAWIDRKAWSELEGCRLLDLQHLHLVDEHFHYESLVSTHHNITLSHLFFSLSLRFRNFQGNSWVWVFLVMIQTRVIWWRVHGVRWSSSANSICESPQDMVQMGRWQYWPK